MFKDSPAFSGFSTNDIAAAKAFYGETLGLEVHEMNGMLTLHLSTGGKVIIYSKENHQPASYTVLNFPVADIDETVAELTQKGVSFEHYDMGPGMKQDEKGILRGLAMQKGPDIAWFTDPAGNILSVIEKDG